MKIKFITLNIWHGGVLFQNVVDFLKKERPDILCIQEVYDSHDKTLEKRFRAMEEFQKEFEWLPYSKFAPTVIDRATKAPWGNAVLSKFEITYSQNHMFNLPIVEKDMPIVEDPMAAETPQGMLETKILIGEKEVLVCSLHGVWDRHGGDTSVRLEMEKVIAETVKGKETVILAGDTNFNPDTEIARRIEKYLVSVFGQSLPSTFNMKHKTKPGYATAAVDMIFVSKNIKVLNRNCPDVDVSDHLPLVVDLEI